MCGATRRTGWLVAAVVLLPVLASASVRASSTHLECGQQQRRHQLESEAHRLLHLLKCDILPLVRVFARLLPQLGGPANVLHSMFGMAELMKLGERSERSRSMWTDYLALERAADEFHELAMGALDKREFCTYPTVVEFGGLRRFAGANSQHLLGYIYDIITIDYHTYCLADALGRLPQVPALVREVVEIYLAGADQHVAAHTPLLLGSDGERSVGELEFDVQQALARNGPLAKTSQLVFSMTNTDNTVQGFKSACKEFLIQIGERWQSMEMMSKMLNTDGNGIERVNNYIMRRLVPTKYADICSQLSAAS